ncbi:MAG TPA: hypothetical protein VMO00_10325, partial [Methylomirabilota bacterium]|nr:hypothetical protein [Methylomirabilota bacterium]
SRTLTFLAVNWFFYGPSSTKPRLLLLHPTPLQTPPSPPLFAAAIILISAKAELNLFDARAAGGSFNSNVTFELFKALIFGPGWLHQSWWALSTSAGLSVEKTPYSSLHLS